MTNKYILFLRLLWCIPLLLIFLQLDWNPPVVNSTCGVHLCSIKLIVQTNAGSQFVVETTRNSAGRSGLQRTSDGTTYIQSMLQVQAQVALGQVCIRPWMDQTRANISRDLRLWSEKLKQTREEPQTNESSTCTGDL